MQTCPYVGITGVTSRAQSEALMEVIDGLNWPESHKLMIGVLSNYNALAWGGIAKPTLNLPVERIDGTLLIDRRVSNLVHYHSRALGLYAQLRELTGYTKIADGIQLNISWPDPRELARFRAHRYCVVVLQIGPTAYASAGGTPQNLVTALRSYAGLVDAVLLDPSAGTGRSFEWAYAQSNLEALVASQLNFRWGIAGGLGASEIDRLQDLLQICPDMSWDAQSRLRDSGNRLDIGACRDYLVASCELLTRARKPQTALASLGKDC